MAPPQVPQAPTGTIAFYDSYSVGTGKTLTVNLQANTNALTLDQNATGPVSLTVTPPPGASVPSNFPSTVTMTGGKVSLTTSFPSSGYYRVQATGPDGSAGWTTVDVSVSPNTAP